MQLDDVLINVDNTSITVHDVITYLKVHGIFRNAVCRLVEAEVIRRKAEELGVFREDDFREFLQSKRRYWGLLRAEELHAFCQKNGITHEQWVNCSRDEFLRMVVRRHVITAKKIKEYFATNRDKLLTITVSRIMTSEPEKAKAVLQEAQKDPGKFPELAREHSIEENTRNAGGYLGTVRRGMLPPVVDAAVFAAERGDIIGPFEENGRWTVYHIDAVFCVELDAALKADITERLFQQWLRDAIRETMSRGT